MLTTIHNRTLSRAAVFGLLVVLTGACGKKGYETKTETTSPGAVAPAATSSPIQVTDVALGRALGSDKRVTDQTDDFKPNDQIYASIHTAGTAQNVTLATRWTFEDGQVVSERSESISPTGDAYTEFHISKPSGWPEGKYTLHVLINGQEVQTKDFKVEK